MKGRTIHVGVTGLNATDNPAPGVGVLRSLSMGAPPEQRLVGLAYDALDPGVYAANLASSVFLLPYPSCGRSAFLSRLAYVHEQVGLDVLIPTLDAELPVLIAVEEELRAMGIAVVLPTREQLDLRTKSNLVALGNAAGIHVPQTVTVSHADDLHKAQQKLPYPFFVKGLFYGATLVNCYEEAVAAFHRIAAVWGTPVILQARAEGEEMNLVGLGDGKGGILGAVPMKKLALTDKGKGWAGVTVRDPMLLDVAERFVRATRWRGPFEVEAIRTEDGKYALIEVNPRFPAWVHLATEAGVNLPRAAVDLALGRTPERLDHYEVGKMFVRISLDQIVSIADFERIVTAGEIQRATTPRSSQNAA